MRLRPDLLRKLAYALAVPVLFLTGAGLSYRYDAAFGIERRADTPDPGSLYVPRYQRESGPQLVMVYVGASTCGWSNQPGLPEAVEEIKLRLAREARENGMSFQALGVALDWVPELGMAHLAKFGLFDETAAGYNWGNRFALRHLWPDGATRPSTPLVLVYTRTFVAPRDSTDALMYGERDPRTFAVKRGVAEITRWAESHALLPGLVIGDHEAMPEEGRQPGVR